MYQLKLFQLKLQQLIEKVWLDRNIETIWNSELTRHDKKTVVKKRICFFFVVWSVKKMFILKDCLLSSDFLLVMGLLQTSISVFFVTANWIKIWTPEEKIFLTFQKRFPLLFAELNGLFKNYNPKKIKQREK